MTKEQAMQLVRERARPEGLVKEAMETFMDFCVVAEALGHVDYAKEARDALYEWDI